MIRVDKICVVMLSVLSVLACRPDRKEEIRKPNIIYILADDLGYGDLGIYGQERFSTPNLDRLAAEGMIFTQHYAGSTVCAPSRSALMTGLHTGHTPVRGNRPVEGGQFPLPEGTVTISKILKDAGYVTGAFGKWGLGYPGSTGDPLNQGFDTFFGYNSQTVAHNYYPWELQEDDKDIALPANEGTNHGTYAPNLIHAKTLNFIRDNRDTAFFLYVPTVLPHAELFAPEEYMDLFLETAVPESSFERKSKFAPETPYVGVDDPSHPRYKIGAYGSQPQPRAAFAAMVTLLDQQVGEILDLIDSLGIADNTLLVFTSDNGPHQEGGADPDFFNSNGPFRGYKRDLYEGGIRVPMLVRWPSVVPANASTDHISAFWDVLPTFAEVAGVQTNENLDGISFLPTLQGRQQLPHDFLYWEFHEQGGKQAIRRGEWKLIRYGVKEGNGYESLYNLSSDPSESDDVSERYPDVMDELRAILDNARVDDPQWPFAP